MIDPGGILLAIETSQREGSVALRLPDGSMLEHAFACGTRGEDYLLPSIDILFARAKLSPSDLGTVAVSVGPGGFTGLRIAISTAKGLSEGTGCRLVAVPSAMVAAESTVSIDDQIMPVVVLAATKSTTCWLSRLDHLEGRWVESDRSGLHVVDPPDESVLELCSGATVLADRFLPDELAEQLSDAHRILEPRWTAAACARIGHHFSQDGRIVDPLQMAPIYPREPEAVSLWKARKG